MMITKQDQRHVILICFAETIMAAIANECQPNTRRHNQALAVIERIKKLDATYHGHLPDEAFVFAEQFLGQMEDEIRGFLEFS